MKRFLVVAALALSFAVPCTSIVRAEEDGFKPIFNGENLDGWAGDEKFWRVEDGMIVGETTAENRTSSNTFLIWTEQEPADFELKLRYRIASKEANSGVQVRSERVGDFGMKGYQPDIATVDWITGIHYEERGRGILARRGEEVTFDSDGKRQATRFAEEAELLKEIHGDDWNEYHIICRGNTLISKINGKKMHHIVDDAPQARQDGLIGLQLHTGPPMTLHFKDVRLKMLD